MTLWRLALIAGTFGMMGISPVVAAPTLAQAQEAATSVRGHRARYAVFVDGAPVDFGGVRLEISNGGLSVPLVPMGHAMGVVMHFHPEKHTASLSRGNLYVELTGWGSSPHSMVPLHLICDALGATIAKSRAGDIAVIEIAMPPVSSSAVPAPTSAAPPSGPVNDADPACFEYNLDRLNAYRAKIKAPPLQLDAQLGDFARAGSLQLLNDHLPHGHIKAANVWAAGFIARAAENQGDPNGWPLQGITVQEAIDQILQAMIDEGPGGGHHDNMLNAEFRRVGIGLIVNDNKLYLTNDFSD